MFLAIAFTFIILAYVFNSTFWSIISGILAIAAGLDFLDGQTEWIYIIFGTGIIVTGLYQIIMVPVDLLNKGE